MSNYIGPTMARRVLKVVSGAIAVALAERPELTTHRDEAEIHEHSQPQAQNMETSARSDVLAFCCLKAEKDSTGKKQTLSIDFMVPGTSHPDPYKCELTSTIRIDACSYVGQEGVAFGQMQVWPLPNGSIQVHDCEQKCKEDMERYPKYHERLISQAKSDKEVEDALRATAQLGFERDYSGEMYKIHEKYKDDLISAAKEATTATKTSIDKLATGESSDAKELKTEFETKLKEFQTETRKIRPTKDKPDEDIEISSSVNSVAVSTESDLQASVAAHNKSLLDLLSTMKDEVNGYTSEFKKTFDTLNKERIDAEQQAQQTLAQEKKKLEEQAQAEQVIIDQLAQEQQQKAPQEPPVLQGTTVPEECSHQECCCTIKLEEKEGTNVKVATNFLNWDVCQFPEVLQWKAGWAGGFSSWTAKMGMTKCSSGFLTDCADCAKRSTCTSKGVGDCVRAAQVTKIA